MIFYNLFIPLFFFYINVNKVSISDDVRDSIIVYDHVRRANTTNGNLYNAWFRRSGDLSSFFIGVLLSTNEDFMGGIPSNDSTVQIELRQTRNSNNDYTYSENWTQAPEALFLEDKIFKIYSMKPAGRKQINIMSITLDQIAAGAL